MSDKYTLARDPVESARLEKQNSLYGIALGYQLYPALQKRLTSPSAPPSEPLAVAEIATGTSIWLRELSAVLPKSVSLHGWDISPDQFPPAASLPPNLSLHLHDATKPFPEEYQGVFDIVHIRLLVLGLDADDWKAVARNAFTLLKPGGAIQWDDADFTICSQTYRSAAQPDQGSLQDMRSLWAMLCEGPGPDRFSGWEGLQHALPEVGFVNCEHDAVLSNRDPTQGRELVQNGIDACFAMMKTIKSKFGIGRDLEELEERKKVIEKAADNGAYWVWGIHVFVGYKP